MSLEAHDASSLAPVFDKERWACILPRLISERSWAKICRCSGDAAPHVVMQTPLGVKKEAAPTGRTTLIWQLPSLESLAWV